MKNVDLNNVKIAFEYKSNAELNRTYLIYKIIQKPFWVDILTRITRFIFAYKLPFQFLIEHTVYKVFCAGKNRNEVAKTMNNLKKYGVNTVLDYVAEGDSSEALFELNMKTIISNIEFVHEQAKDAFIGVKLSGLEDVNFIKQIDTLQIGRQANFQDRFKIFVSRVDAICSKANSLKVKVYFDAEERSTQDVFDFVVDQMMAKYNKDQVFVYNTLQMYFKDRIKYLENLIIDAKRNNYMLGIKLVRGAYVEKEIEFSKQNKVECPVFTQKIETDQSFDHAADICLKEHQFVHTCLATHNQSSIELALELIYKYDINDHFRKVFFSQLFGMSDNLTFNLAANKFNASKYVPYGELEKAIPYLLRRAEENSAIEGQVSREFELLHREKIRRNSANP